jgi:hypothetical protein
MLPPVSLLIERGGISSNYVRSVFDEQEWEWRLTFRVKSPYSPQWLVSGDDAARVDVGTILEVMVFDVIFKNRAVETYWALELMGTGGVRVENIAELVSVSVTQDSTEELLEVATTVVVDVYEVSNPEGGVMERVFKTAVEVADEPKPVA